MSRIKTQAKNVGDFILSPFEQNLREFVEQKTPCELFTLYYPRGMDPDFDGWLESTAGKVRDCLETLYSDHEILPAAVLLILATTKHLQMTRPQPLRRDKRQRHQDIKAIDAALEVLETYPAADVFLCSNGLMVKEEMGQEWTVKGYLKTLKRVIGMTRQNKESDVEMRFCAQTLAEFFKEITGKPMYEVVGSLLVYAFEWPRGHGDLRLAAIQRAEGPSINAKRSTLREALDLQKQDYSFWKEKQTRFHGLFAAARRSSGIKRQSLAR